MQLIQFLFVGLIAGWIMGRLRRGRGYGLIGNLVVGVLGSFIGGFVFGFLNLSPDNTPLSLLMALVGAIVLFLVVDLLRPGSRRSDSKDED